MNIKSDQKYNSKNNKRKYYILFIIYGVSWGIISSTLSVVSAVLGKILFQFFPFLGVDINKDISMSFIFGTIAILIIFLLRKYLLKNGLRKNTPEGVLGINKIFGSMALIGIGYISGHGSMLFVFTAPPMEIANIFTILLIISCFSYFGLFLPSFEARYGSSGEI